MKYNTLNQLTAKNLEAGKHADGQGLWLVKRSRGAGKWILRSVIFGQRREMGLGPWPDVTIAEAREQAAKARRAIRDGRDPIEERRKLRRRSERISVTQAVEGCFEARQAELKGDGKAGRWLSPLQIHVLPKIGKQAIEDVDQHVIKETLEPIWHKKADTARKAMNRLNLTLKYAAALGLDVDLQATMKARALMGKQRHEATHIPSMPYTDLPGFYTWLRHQPLASCQALRFLILTAARTSEVRFITLDEVIDDTWIVPANRTKTGAEHRVPLCREAQKIVASQSSGKRYLFLSPTGRPLSDAAMASLMKREGLTARPHGFRATFRTWVEEQTNTPFEVKEAALGHKVDKGVVAAYQRSDRLEKRRELMEQWQVFLLGGAA